MSDENDPKDPPQDSPADPPKNDPPPSDPPPPPAPKPDGEPVTRGEFNGVIESITALTQKITDLIDTRPGQPDSRPVSVPWTHRGSKARAE